MDIKELIEYIRSIERTTKAFEELDRTLRERGIIHLMSAQYRVEIFGRARLEAKLSKHIKVDTARWIAKKMPAWLLGIWIFD